jgi:hypothetical protein
VHVEQYRLAYLLVGRDEDIETISLSWSISLVSDDMDIYRVLLVERLV